MCLCAQQNRRTESEAGKYTLSERKARETGPVQRTGELGVSTASHELRAEGSGRKEMLQCECGSGQRAHELRTLLQFVFIWQMRTRSRGMRRGW